MMAGLLEKIDQKFESSFLRLVPISHTIPCHCVAKQLVLEDHVQNQARINCNDHPRFAASVFQALRSDSFMFRGQTASSMLVRHGFSETACIVAGFRAWGVRERGERCGR